jgi:hypothetical protein
MLRFAAQLQRATATNPNFFNCKNMKLHSPTSSPAQEAKLALLSSNFFGKVNIKQRTPAEEEAYQQQVDALPQPPTWFRAPMISDPTQLYETFTTLTAEQIKEKVDLLVARHVKQSYQNALVAAGSVEKLKALQREAHEQHEQRRQERCQAAGVDFEPDTFD